MARIQHKDLTDDLLHEPKGASTASTGTVYVADGEGAGTFKKLPVDSLDFDVEEIDPLTADEGTDIAALDGSNLLAVTTGEMTNMPYTSAFPQTLTDLINKNFAELYTVHSNMATIAAELKKDITDLTNKVNELLTILNRVGVVDSE